MGGGGFGGGEGGGRGGDVRGGGWRLMVVCKMLCERVAGVGVGVGIDALSCRI